MKTYELFDMNSGNFVFNYNDIIQVYHLLEIIDSSIDDSLDNYQLDVYSNKKLIETLKGMDILDYIISEL